ncbi:MAG: hypothetical protein JSW63_00575 [Ignavibacterium sp.]|nr:MAG: hypothetical protein JSW63_00575 [Ignavibacterium sp.]
MKYILDMKSGIIGLLSIIIIASAVYAGAFLDYFHGHSEGDDVRLEWRTGEEVNLQRFVIERKTPQSPFVELATIDPKGSNSFYSFLDEAAYKTEDLVFIYRLKIIDNDGATSHSSEVTVSHNVSGVKRTWGSIKAMFR